MLQIPQPISKAVLEYNPRMTAEEVRNLFTSVSGFLNYTSGNYKKCFIYQDVVVKIPKFPEGGYKEFFELEAKFYERCLLRPEISAHVAEHFLGVRSVQIAERLTLVGSTVKLPREVERWFIQCGVTDLYPWNLGIDAAGTVKLLDLCGQGVRL